MNENIVKDSIEFNSIFNLFNFIYIPSVTINIVSMSFTDPLVWPQNKQPGQGKILLLTGWNLERGQAREDKKKKIEKVFTTEEL